MKAFLILEDGNVFEGTSFGADKEVISEIVFNTSMTGYLEVLTDPSYAGQAVVMTYPLIGNYGICPSDMESKKLWPDGFIVRELSKKASNFRQESTIDDFLKKYDIPGIAGVDTRALTKILRESGTMNGFITTNENYDLQKITKQLKEYKVTGVVKKVTCDKKYTTTKEAFVPTDYEMAKMTYMAAPDMKQAIEEAKEAGADTAFLTLCSMQGTQGILKLKSFAEKGKAETEEKGSQIKEKRKQIEERNEQTKERNQQIEKRNHYKVALLDYGSKKNIEHCLLKRGCEVTVYPADTKAEEIIKDKPNGIMLSNGPGDPAECVEMIEEIKKLLESDIPIFAICLGHQLMALANGFSTEKMKYGHRGANHPVKDLVTGRVYLSSQNHGYVVVNDSINKEIAEVRFINANDKTIEGLYYKNKNVFTVQFHPEACAGPQDSEFLFDEFIKMIAAKKA